MLTSTPFKSSEEVFDWISTFTNLEKTNGKRNFSLDNMKILTEAAGHPERCAPSFHVAGSKGKGSVTGMISAILETSGLNTASYTSPHVLDFRERLSTGKGFFDEGIYTFGGNELWALVNRLKDENMEKPSFFELFTLWFFLCARHSNCDVMTVETGMGGRLDATNILDPLVSVITPIELEHTEYLGKTIPIIAGEKAGIIKPGRPLVLAGQEAEALEVFKEQAALNKSPLLYFPDYAKVQKIKLNKQGVSFSLSLRSPTAAAETLRYPELFVPMPVEVQAKNAGLAVLAVKTAFPHVKEGEIRKALSTFTLPARFESISGRPPLVIDGAHTKNSIYFCIQSFTALFGKGGILVFGCATGKDVSSMAELCMPEFSRFIITRPGTFKESCPEQVYSTFVMEAGKLKKPPELFFIPETAEALTRAVNIALAEGLPILGTGSFYLAAEIKKLLKKVI